MKLEKIAKSIENIKNNATKIIKFPLVLLLSASAVILFGCNKLPDTFITKKFKDGGEVEYTFSGEDVDGYINHIDVEFNDSGTIHDFNDGDLYPIPIIQGPNTVKAIAYDNMYAPDDTPATDSFVSPTEEEAEELIDNIFAEKSGTYNTLEKNVLVSIGASDDFYVDYLIGKKDGTDAIINYTGYKKNLEEECSNKELLDLYGIPNLHLVRIPESEINLKLNDFIDKDYN